MNKKVKDMRNENILLLCPRFMGYEKKIIESMSKCYNVCYVNTEQFLESTRKRYNRLPLWIKAVLKSFPSVRELLRERWLCEFDNDYIKIINSFEIHEFRYIVAINGDGVSNNIYKHLIKKFSGATFIIYIWDDFKNLFKHRHVRLFDKALSYNIEDCRKYDYTYLSVFTDKSISFGNIAKKYDISIIASATEKRVEFAKRLYERYYGKFEFYIYFYSKDRDYGFFTYSTPLPYEEYIQKIAESKATVEIVRYHQRGPTTRIFDALQIGTKLITTNDSINKYPIYNDNILILDKRYNIPDYFIETPFKEGNFQIYSSDEWFKLLIQEI